MDRDELLIVDLQALELLEDDLTSKYPGYKNERYKAAINALYAELKK